MFTKATDDTYNLSATCFMNDDVDKERPTLKREM